MLVIAIGSCLLVSTLQVSEAGAAPPTKEELAERMHQRALKAIKGGKLADAAQLWEEAEAMRPHWKYAFNLTFCRVQQEKWLQGWGALERAKANGLPEKHGERAGAIEKQLRAELMKGHAWLELRVEPASAAVQRDGQPWSAPWATWVTGESSTVRVEAKGHEPIERKISHSAGAVYRESVRLVARPRDGELLVTGTPEGASVLVDGKAAGALPRAALAKVSAGPHRVDVKADGYHSFSATVTVLAGRPATQKVALERVEVPVPKPEPTDDGISLGVWGWTALGIGVAAGGGGGGMLAWASSIAEDASSLGAGAEYEAAESDFEIALPTGYALIGLGGALITTGIVLLLLDGDDDPGQSTFRVEPFAVPGGGGVRTGFEF